MAKAFVCSQCRTSLIVPGSMLGKWVRCPNCHESFLAEDHSPLPPAEPTAIKPGKAPIKPEADQGQPTAEISGPYLQVVRQTLDERERMQAWDRVRNGLKIMHAGLIVFGGALVGITSFSLLEILLLDLLGPKLLGLGWVPVPDGIDQVFGFLVVAGLVVYLVGAGLGSMQVSKGRWLLAHALLLLIFCGVAMEGFLGPGLDDLDSDFSKRTKSIAFILLIATTSAACLVCHLKKLAHAVRNSPLDKSCVRLGLAQFFWFCVLTILLSETIFHAQAFQRALWHDPDPPIQILVFWLLGLGFIGVGGGTALLIWTLRLLRETSNSIHPEELTAEQ